MKFYNFILNFFILLFSISILFLLYFVLSYGLTDPSLCYDNWSSQAGSSNPNAPPLTTISLTYAPYPTTGNLGDIAWVGDTVIFNYKGVDIQACYKGPLDTYDSLYYFNDPETNATCHTSASSLNLTVPNDAELNNRDIYPDHDASSVHNRNLYKRFRLDYDNFRKQREASRINWHKARKKGWPGKDS